MSKTLEEQFPYPKKAPKEKYKNYNEEFIKSSLRIINIIRYIVKNKCVLEVRPDCTNNDNWRISTLREFLSFATGTIYKESPEETGFQNYLKWWRIKTKPNDQELYDICHVK